LIKCRKEANVYNADVTARSVNYFVPASTLNWTPRAGQDEQEPIKYKKRLHIAVVLKELNQLRILNNPLHF